MLVLAAGLDSPAVLKAIEDAWLPALDEADPAVRLLAELGAFAGAGLAAVADGGTAGPVAPSEATMNWAVVRQLRHYCSFGNLFPTSFPPLSHLFPT